jgi:hypothetical protein
MKANKKVDERWDALVADYRTKRDMWARCEPSDAANKSYFATLDALAAYRVSTLHDLMAKIEIIDADYDEGDIPHERLAEILADVRHLAGEKLDGIEMAERVPVSLSKLEKPRR